MSHPHAPTKAEYEAACDQIATVCTDHVRALGAKLLGPSKDKLEALEESMVEAVRTIRSYGNALEHERDAALSLAQDGDELTDDDDDDADDFTAPTTARDWAKHHHAARVGDLVRVSRADGDVERFLAWPLDDEGQPAAGYVLDPDGEGGDLLSRLKLGRGDHAVFWTPSRPALELSFVLHTAQAEGKRGSERTGSLMAAVGHGEDKIVYGENGELTAREGHAMLAQLADLGAKYLPMHASDLADAPAPKAAPERDAAPLSEKGEPMAPLSDPKADGAACLPCEAKRKAAAAAAAGGV